MIKILVQLHRPGRIECLVIDAGAYRWLTIGTDIDHPDQAVIAAAARIAAAFPAAGLRIVAPPATAPAAGASNVIPLHR